MCFGLFFLVCMPRQTRYKKRNTTNNNAAVTFGVARMDVFFCTCCFIQKDVILSPFLLEFLVFAIEKTFCSGCEKTKGRKVARQEEKDRFFPALGRSHTDMCLFFCACLFFSKRRRALWPVEYCVVFFCFCFTVNAILLPAIFFQ